MGYEIVAVADYRLPCSQQKHRLFMAVTSQQPEHMLPTLLREIKEHVAAKQ
jgi:hypothetical protein